MSEVSLIIESFRARGVELWVDGDRLHYRASEGSLREADLGALREHKQQIVASLKSPAHAEQRSTSRGTSVPLSFGQMRMWVTTRLLPESTEYNSSAAFRLQGTLNVDALKAALQRIVERHQSLRTVFAHTDDEPRQMILDQYAHQLLVVEVPDCPDHDARLRTLAMDEARTPFDLERGPLLRTTLLRIDPGSHVLLISTHHIVSDGWSMDRFVAELSILYAAFAEGRPDPLPALPMQYADYARWQREWLQGERLSRQIEYWRNELSGAAPRLDLPVDRPRSARRSEAGAQWPITIPPQLTRGLIQLATNEASTLFMTLLAAYQLLLYRYSGQDDLCVGVPIANRNRLEADQLIGFFVNTLIMRARLRGDMTFRELLAQVRERAVHAFENQDLPIDMLLYEIDERGTSGLSAYRQACFTLQTQAPGTRATQQTGVSSLPRLEALHFDSGTCKSDLLLALGVTEGGVLGHCEYSTELFDQATIAAFADNFSALLEQVVGNPQIKLADILLEAGYRGAAQRGDAAGRTALSRAQRTQMDRWHPLADARPQVRMHAACVELTGAVDVERLQRAIRHVTSVSLGLRARMSASHGDMIEAAMPETIALAIEDFSGSADPRGDALDWIERDCMRGMDPADGSTVRYGLLEIAPDRSLWSVHADPLFVDEHGLWCIAQACARAYRGAADVAGDGADATPDDNVFLEQIYMEREQRCSARLLQECAAWREHGDHSADNLACVTHSTADAHTLTGPSVRLTDAAVAELTAFARDHGCELKGVLIAGTALYLWRVAAARNQEQARAVTVGLPFTGRTVAGATALIGCFGSVRPWPVRFQQALTVAGYVQEQCRRLIDAKIDEPIDTEKVRRALGLADAQAPFSTLIHCSDLAALDFDGIPARYHFLAPDGGADLVLCWRCDVQASSIELQLHGSSASYEQWELQVHARNLEQFLTALVRSPDATIEALPLVSGAAQSAVVDLGRGDQSMEHLGMTLAERIVAVARERSQHPAIVAPERTLTYADLERKSGRVADHLAGLPTAGIVAVHGEASCEVLAALLGIWRVGLPYLVIDPALPPERILMMLDDCDARVVLSTSPDKLPLGDANRSVWNLRVVADGDSRAIPREESRIATGPDGLAYCVYTSGSSGKPKAVAVSQRSVANHCLYARSAYELSPADRVLQFSSLGFDASVEEIFPTWLAGATLVLRDSGVPSVSDFSELILRERITVLDLPTAYWQHWVAAAGPDVIQHGSLRLVIVGGERVSAESFRRWRTWVGTERIVWLNTYGPTETTVISTVYRADAATDARAEIPIGRPIWNTQIYVLDGDRRPVPIGVAGEIYIGGAGVARGYLNRTQLTQERFVSDPFSEQAGARMYRTGDVGRWLRDGELEYLGRNDQQVKLRGYRIELGEIEVQLSRHAGVGEAVVMVREDGRGDKQLVAYYTGSVELSAEELRAQVRQELPEYMVPSAYVRMEALPLTPNGKLDRRSLPAPDAQAYARKQYEAPRGETEQALAQLWCELLRIDQVGREDNFFELGGHSLLAVQMMVRIRRLFEIELQVLRVFESPTLAALADVVLSAQLAQFDEMQVQQAAAEIERSGT